MLAILQITNSHNNKSDSFLRGPSLDNKYDSIQVSVSFLLGVLPEAEPKAVNAG